MGGGRDRARHGASADDGDASAQKALLVSGDAAAGDFVHALRLHCLKRRDTALKVLGHESGVGEARLRDFLRSDPAKRRRPTYAEVLSVWAAIAARDPAAGAAFATRSLAAAGLRAEADDSAPEPLIEAAAELSADVAEILRTAAGGGCTSANADQVHAVAERIAREAKAIDHLAREARG